MGRRPASWGRWALAVSMLAASLVLSVGIAMPLAAAPPNAVPPGPDTTVPFDPPQTVQRNGQSVQVRTIRKTLTADGHEAVADRIIVGFRPGVSDAEKAAVHRSVASQGKIPATALKNVGTNANYVDITGASSLETAIKMYLADPRVSYAQPDYIVHTAETPNDPSFTQQYGMTKIQAPAAWNTTHGSPTVKIAILDCGIYEAHPDLTGKVVARQDFTSSPYGTDDQCNHGTHVAGIASANTNNGTGVAGVGYNTALMNGKVLIETYYSDGTLQGGEGSTSWIASGITWAADNGANVINMSLGAQLPCEQAFQDAITYAWSKNVVVVAAAGNQNTNTLFEPASCTHVVAVASTDQSDARSSFSNYGSWVQVAAPGSSIYSSVNPNIAENNGQAYAYFNGTSMATPHVAGLAGLLWATSYGTSADAVVSRIEATADPILGTGTNWQYGRINAAAAVTGGAFVPHPTAVTPSSGSASGGTTITISGSLFKSGATVTIGGTAATVISVTSSIIVATTPTHAVGTVNLVVTNPDGQTGTLANAFTFTAIPPPRIVPANPLPSPSVVIPVPRVPGAPSPASGAPTPAPLPPSRS